jgi:pimeloyl-ACP methyl ester carboxylesterase
MGAGLGAFFRLLRWLGPWTPESRIPAGVRHKDLEISSSSGDQPASRIRVYVPQDRAIRGALYVIPGVHHEGAADPRMVRFCSVLADAGMVVGSPFIPDLMSLSLTERAVKDTIKSVEVFLDLSEIPDGVKPGLFCISTASILGIHAASDSRIASRIGGLVLFGGFADWERSLRFMLTGEMSNGHSVEPDPLNRTVVFLNMIPWLEGAPSDPVELAELWTRFVHETWEKPEMQTPERYLGVAAELSEQARPEWRALFEKGTSLRPGGLESLEHALQSWKEGPTDWLDPAPRMSEIRCPVSIVHGRDDRVIPWTEASELAAHLPSGVHTGTWVTGFYDHTGHSGPLRLFLRLPLLPIELWRSIRIVWAFVRASGMRSRQTA